MSVLLSEHFSIDPTIPHSHSNSLHPAYHHSWLMTNNAFKWTALYTLGDFYPTFQFDFKNAFILQMNSTSQVSRDDLLECVISRRQGSENLQNAVVPMWVVYQFLVSVVLLRILIVMMTITYKKIYDNLDTQWK